MKISKSRIKYSNDSYVSVPGYWCHTESGCGPSQSPQTQIFFVIEIFSIFPEPLMTWLTDASSQMRYHQTRSDYKLEVYSIWRNLFLKLKIRIRNGNMTGKTSRKSVNHQEGGGRTAAALGSQVMTPAGLWSLTEINWVLSRDRYREIEGEEDDM